MSANVFVATICEQKASSSISFHLDLKHHVMSTQTMMFWISEKFTRGGSNGQLHPETHQHLYYSFITTAILVKFCWLAQCFHYSCENLKEDSPVTKELLGTQPGRNLCDDKHYSFNCRSGKTVYEYRWWGERSGENEGLKQCCITSAFYRPSSAVFNCIP